MRLNRSRKSVAAAAVLAVALLFAACLAQSPGAGQGGAPKQSRPRIVADAPVNSQPAGEARATSETAPPTFDQETDLVIFPSKEVEFIVGPQLRSGSSRNPFPWFDRVASEHGRLHGRGTPRAAPRVLTGTLTLRRGGTEAEGAGTRFISEVDPAGPPPRYNGHLRVLMPDGKTYRETKVARVESDTRLVLAAPWGFEQVAGARADTHRFDPVQNSWNYDAYYDAMYYDLALVQYTNYYRTGDPQFLDYARKAADSWWASPYVDHGTVVGGPNNLPPRSMAYAGLMLRALDGRPEMWDYLERQTRAAFDNWIALRLSTPKLYSDLRELGYVQLYAVLLARVLPDSYALYSNGTQSAATGRVTNGAARRRAFLADAGKAAVNYFGRLQQADGSWRWDLWDGSMKNFEQPFMVGIYLEAAAALHALSRDEAVRASLRAQIERSCRHLWTQAYRGREPVSDLPGYRWRGMWYFWGGGTAQNPAAYERGEGERKTNGDPGMIRQVRHLNSTVHHAFGHAYALSGDEEFLRAGDEVFDASFGDRVDKLHGLADEGRAKNYAMNFRASGRYLALRLRGSAAR